MDSNCDPKFRQILSRVFRIKELEAQTAVVVGLWNDATIAYVSSAWRHFATDNGGQPEIKLSWGVGHNYLAAIAEPLRNIAHSLNAGIGCPTGLSSRSTSSHTELSRKSTKLVGPSSIVANASQPMIFERSGMRELEQWEHERIV